MILTGAMAFDKSVRSTDKDGRLHIAKTHISKACVNAYYGSEIPNSQALGLIPTQIYYLFRDPLELARAASTFARLPILSQHVPVSADSPRQDLIVGAIGSDVEFNDPYLDADVCIWESGAIAGIETDTVREFSCAYRYVAVMTPGEYHGQRYDGVMTEIHGNHLALVEQGRAGSDVLAADEDIKMAKTTKLGKALFLTLGGMSTKLAQDSAMLALVGQSTGKTLNVAEVSSKLIAMDADLDPKKITGAISALVALDSGDDTMSEDEDEHPKDCDCKECKAVAKDEDEDEDEKAKRLAKDADKKLEGAMDAFKAELREADEARRAVRSVVGDVIAQDSAAGIYGFALDHLKVEHEGVTDARSLKALFTLANRHTAPAPRIAQDAAGLATMFPNANRFAH